MIYTKKRLLLFDNDVTNIRLPKKCNIINYNRDIVGRVLNLRKDKIGVIGDLDINFKDCSNLDIILGKYTGASGKHLRHEKPNFDYFRIDIDLGELI